MKTGMERLRMHGKRLNAWLDRHALALGAALALLLAALLAVHNVSAGPLHNLNDIGTWENRALFIAMAAAVHACALLAATGLSCLGTQRRSFARIALRQIILTAGLYILLLPINQKTYAYTMVLQPIVRAMDEGGLAAGLAMESNLSAPAMTLLYIVTRGPVYDMYLTKLLCIGCMLLLSLLALHAADGARLGMRAEALLTLCMILPQGFMNAACSAQMDIVSIALLGVSLTLAMGKQTGKRMTASALALGLAMAMSGVALYALPVYVLLLMRGRMTKRHAALAAGVAVLLCVPAMLAGMEPLDALGSLLRANFGQPAYASGAPNVMSLIPRAAVEEMPQYAALRALSTLDLETNAQPYYTAEQYAIVMRGLTWAALAAYMGVCAHVLRGAMKPVLAALALTLCALLACPNATASAWLAADVLCLYVLVAEPKGRVPACMVLFATAGASCYPLAEEILLPMAAACALCVLALCALLDVIPMGRGKAHA